MIRRLRSPELIVMGLLAAVCGLFLAILLSAEFGAQSSGPPAALKTVKTPTPDLAKLRPAAVRSKQKVKHHRRAHREKNPAPVARPAGPPAVAQVQEPASTGTAYPKYTQGYQQSSAPVQQFSAPSNPKPVAAPVKKPASHPKSGSGGGGTFDDSG